jgi:hypothetical protein
VSLGELEPYVVSTDHDGVELELPLAPAGEAPWWVRLWPALFFAPVAWCMGAEGFLSGALLLGGLASLGLVWAVYGGEPARVRLRLERHALTLRGRRLSTSELARVETTDTSLVLHHADGTSEWLELSLEPPHLLEELAAILQRHADEDRLTSGLPLALQRMRSQMPEQG